MEKELTGKVRSIGRPIIGSQFYLTVNVWDPTQFVI
jgi:hypothetical protein